MSALRRTKKGSTVRQQFAQIVMKPDLVSPQLRQIEREIDKFYKCNGLFAFPFAEAAWYFLAHCEEMSLKANLHDADDGIQQLSCEVDGIVNAAKWPLRWLRKECSAGGHIPTHFPNAQYNQAWELFDLAVEYQAFETAFTYASAGRITLAVEENKLLPDPSGRMDARYEAYECDREKQCLVIELKAFIEPAEAREVIQRDEEIAKGIRQAKCLQTAFLTSPNELRKILQIDDSYSLNFAVASETSIGTFAVQDMSIPVIRLSHLLATTQRKGSLRDVCNWLTQREYLPVRGFHYEDVGVNCRVGQWELQWYGIKPLIAESFL